MDQPTQELQLVVQEDAVRVFDAINEAHGIPAKLTAQDGTEVYVNPGVSPSGNQKRCPERSGRQRSWPR